MQYQILGDNDCPIVEFKMNTGKSVMIEHGSMAYMSGIDLQGKLNSHGGLLGAIGRSLTGGESMFITSLDYHIEIASGMFGFMTGEGLVNKFTGYGQVIIQTRNIRSLAGVVSPYISKSN